MNNTPYFSIIIPTYNRKKELERAIQSVLNQTFSNFEIVVIDDGSTDGTRDWITANYINEVRLKYYFQTNSGLPSLARNLGLTLALGEWICFLDSDDYFHPLKLEKVHSYIENHPAEIAVSHAEYIVCNDKILKINPCSIPEHLDQYDWLITKGNFLSTSTMTIRRKILKELNGFDARPEFCIVEDYELWIRLTHKRNVGFIDEPLAYWTQEGNGISAHSEKLCENLRHVLKTHLPQYLSFKNKSDTGEGALIFGNIDYIEARILQKQGAFTKALPILCRSIRMKPFVLKKWFCLAAIFLRVKK